MATRTPHHGVHDHIGPGVQRQDATYFTIHGTRPELVATVTALFNLGEVIVTQEPKPCTEPGNAGACFWLEIVVAGQISLDHFFTAYRAATAADN